MAGAEGRPIRVNFDTQGEIDDRKHCVGKRGHRGLRTTGL
jgi:hypothetical protein